MSKTYIKGKDRALEDTIELLNQTFKSLNINLENSGFLNPAKNIYSLLVKEKSCNILFSNGKGSSKKACMASAYGEFAERLFCKYFFADYYLAPSFLKSDFTYTKDEKWFSYDTNTQEIPKGLLNSKLWQIYNPNDELEALHLIDINSGVCKQGIPALPFKESKSGNSVYFPVNILNNLYVSNGMAFGNSKSEAKVQALCEIYERYVKKSIISKALSLPLVPKSELTKYKQTLDAISELESKNISIRVYDASLGGKFPVVCVALINAKSASTLLSFGSHPSFEVALERTVTELMQGRSLKKLDDLSTPTFNIDEVASPQNLECHFINSTGLISYDFFKTPSSYSYVPWSFEGTTKEELEYLEEIAHKQNLEIYEAFYSYKNLECCRIIIPTVSEIYDIDELIYNNNNEGALFRDAILNLDKLNSNELKELIENFEEFELSNEINIANFIGILPDNNSIWQSLTLGELKTLILLALGDLESASELIKDIIYYNNIEKEHIKFYKCLDALIDIKMQNLELKDYSNSLELIFTKELLKLAQDTIEQKKRFYKIDFPGNELKGFNRHKNLLKIYNRLNLATS